MIRKFRFLNSRARNINCIIRKRERENGRHSKRRQINFTENKTTHFLIKRRTEQHAQNEKTSSSFQGRSCSATVEHGIGYLPWALRPLSGVLGVCVVVFSSPLSPVGFRVWARPLPVLIMVSNLTSNYGSRLKTRGQTNETRFWNLQPK